MHRLPNELLAKNLKSSKEFCGARKCGTKTIQILHDTIDCQKCKDTQKKRNMVQRLSRENT